MIWLSFPILALAAAAQATLLPQIRLFNGQPDLVFLIVLAWSIHATPAQAIVWAFVGGIMQDLLSAAPVGTSTLGLLIVIALLEALRSQLARVGVFTYIGLVLVGGFLIKIVLLVVLIGAGFVVQPIGVFNSNILPSAAYNLVVMLPVYVVMRFIQRRVAPPELDSARSARVVTTEY
jgi:rod shape-determining protein MreD